MNRSRDYLNFSRMDITNITESVFYSFPKRISDNRRNEIINIIIQQFRDKLIALAIVQHTVFGNPNRTDEEVNDWLAQTNLFAKEFGKWSKENLLDIKQPIPLIHSFLTRTYLEYCDYRRAQGGA